jgi:hypothetical protein
VLAITQGDHAFGYKKALSYENTVFDRNPDFIKIDREGQAGA